MACVNNQKRKGRGRKRMRLTFSESVSEYTRPGRYSGGKYALAASGDADRSMTLPRGVNSKVWGVTTGPTPEPPTTPPSATNGTSSFNYKISLIKALNALSSIFIKLLKTFRRPTIFSRGNKILWEITYRWFLIIIRSRITTSHNSSILVFCYSIVFQFQQNKNIWKISSSRYIMNHWQETERRRINQQCM